LFEFSSSQDIVAGLFGGQFGGVDFPKVPNPLAGVVITKVPKAGPVIWGASPWPRVTKTAAQPVTKTACEAVVSAGPLRKLKHPGGRPRQSVTKTPADRMKAYRARKRGAV
jgi:hypothetical protein